MSTKTQNPPKNFQPTQDELNKIEKAFKNEEFRKLFFDYANEIRDPIKRKEYEDELNQLEMEQNPNSQGIEFLHQTADHFISTSDKNIFINIATSTQIKPPELKAMEQNGKKGFGFEIPCTISPSVREYGKKFKVVDVCFHPDTLQMANSNKQFMSQSVHKVAIEQVNNFHKLNLRNDKFLVGKEAKFKGDLDTNIRINASAFEKSNLKNKKQINEIDGETTTKHVKEKLADLKLQTVKFSKKLIFESDHLELDNKCNDNAKRIEILIFCEDIDDRKLVNVDLGTKCVKVLFEKFYKNLEIKLDLPILVDKSKLTWSKTTKTLQLNCLVDTATINQQNETLKTKLPKQSKIYELNEDEIQKFKSSQIVEKKNVEKVHKEINRLPESSEAKLVEAIKFENVQCNEDKLYLTITITAPESKSFPTDVEHLFNSFYSTSDKSIRFDVNVELIEDLEDIFINRKISRPIEKFLVLQFRKRDGYSNKIIKSVTILNETFSKTIILQNDQIVKSKPNPINYKRMFNTPSKSSIKAAKTISKTSNLKPEKPKQVKFKCETETVIKGSRNVESEPKSNDPDLIDENFKDKFQKLDLKFESQLLDDLD